MEECRDWGDLDKAKVLLIGQDPRLKKSNTIAQYCFFGDYYFKDNLKYHSEVNKQNLSKSAFNLVKEITENKYKAEEIYLTNLCNKALPHAPLNEVVYIPEKEALKGVERIKKLLETGKFEYVFPTSLQTNYWLIKSGIYECDNNFLQNTIVKQEGILADEPYFKVEKSGTFKLICGNVYKSKFTSAKFIPLLHPTNYPLKNDLKCHYENCYKKAKEYFKHKS